AAGHGSGDPRGAARRRARHPALRLAPLKPRAAGRVQPRRAGIPRQGDGEEYAVGRTDVSRHLDPPEPSTAPPVPEPTYAERARTLVASGRTGVLSTLSRRRPGHPFGSLMPYALDREG